MNSNNKSSGGRQARKGNTPQKKNSFRKDFKKPRTTPQKVDVGGIRLNKFISNSGICSRREADTYIEHGSVTVNGKVVSEMGKGTRFHIDIPLEISQKQRVREELEVTGLHILLVEDIELNVMIAKALLEKLGQTVDVAMTGQEAIDKVRSTRYDLILLDIQLPDMTGFDVADTIIQEDLVMQTPIVALTANVIKKRDEYLQRGMDDVIAKPVKKSRVIQVFNELFANELEELPPIDIEEPKDDKGLDKIMDVELIQTLVDTIGAEMVTTSLGVFEDKIPEYLEILVSNLTAKEKDEVCSQAHKIKGAASSMGLIRIQRIANEIQQGDHPAWWENVNEWVDELSAAIENDVNVLKDWIAAQKFEI